MQSTFSFYAKYVLGGLVSYVTPRFLVAAGLPLDRWIVTGANWFSLAISNEVALWGLSTGIFLALFATLVALDRRHKPLRNQVTKVSQVPQEIIGTVTGKNPQTAQRDVKVSDALGYIEARAWGHHWSAFITSTETSQPGGSSPREIRQAARDGEIRVWGRTSQNSPHELIPPEYWQIWQVEYFSAMEGNSKTEIAEPGHYGGQIYYDLMVSKLEIESRWPPQVRRIPIKEFIEIAGKSGWDLETNEILDMERGVQQDALFGDLKLWGRRNFQRLPQLNVHEPLQEIPKEHWKDFRPQLLDAMNADKNIFAQSWNREFGNGAKHAIFLDLHIDGSTAIPWLTRNGLQYKGWTAKNEKERLANR